MLLLLAERRIILKKTLHKNAHRICLLILVCYILHISMYSLYSAEHPMKSSSAPLVFISYGTDMEFVLPPLGLNRIVIKKLLPINIEPYVSLDSVIYYPFASYSYQRKNQFVLDQRKYIFKLFPYYFQGNDLKWRNHLSQV